MRNKDRTDIYWARSRVLEYLNQLSGRLPEGVTPQLGPDAMAVGWVFQYALVDETGQQDLGSLRSFLDEAVRRRRDAGQLHSPADLVEAVQTGARERIRPVMMTGLANIVGLFPTMLATGIGADVMKRLAAPTIGGIGSAMLLTLLVIPAIYVIWRWHGDVKLDDEDARA